MAIVLQIHDLHAEEDKQPSRGRRGSNTLTLPLDCLEFWHRKPARAALGQVLEAFWQRTYDLDWQASPAGGCFSYSVQKSSPGTAVRPGRARVLVFRDDLDSIAAVTQQRRDSDIPMVLVSLGAGTTLAALDASLRDSLGRLVGSQDVRMSAAVLHGGRLSPGSVDPVWGLLHTLLAVGVSLSIGCDELLVHQNGVDNLQLPITLRALAAPAARSVHPGVTEPLSELISLMVGERFSIHNPFLARTPSDIAELLLAGDDPGDDPGERAGRERAAAPVGSLAHHQTGQQLERQLERQLDRCMAVLSRSRARPSSENREYDRFLHPFIAPADHGMLDNYIQRIRVLSTLSDSALFRRWSNLPGVRWYVQRREGAFVRQLLIRHTDSVRDALTALVHHYAGDVVAGFLPPTCLLVRALLPSGASSDPTYLQQPTFRLQGDRWVLWFNDGEPVFLNDKLGMRYIRVLLENPHRVYFVAELQSSVAGSEMLVTSDTKILDSEAMRSFKSRIGYLKRELEVANDNNDIGRATLMQEELHDVEDELLRSMGRSGESRKLGENENRRRAISNAIHRSLRDIKKHHRALHAHLKSCLRIGMFLSYQPSEEVFWAT